MRGLHFKQNNRTLYIGIDSNKSENERYDWAILTSISQYGYLDTFNKELMSTEELQLFTKQISGLLEGSLDKLLDLDYGNLSIRFRLIPKNDDNDIKMDIYLFPNGSYWEYGPYGNQLAEDSPFVSITRNDIEYFYYYLKLTFDNMLFRNRQFMEKVRNNRLPSGYRWSLVGNIIDEHVWGEEKITVHGTKHFSSGTKVYMAPVAWGDGYENIIVIGKHRGSRKYVEMIIPSAYVVNWRLGRIYKPEILNMIEVSDHYWWNDTEEDKERIMGYVEQYRKINS